MAQRSVWLLTLTAVLVVVSAGIAWTQETAREKAAEKAIDAADPDQVNPIDIKGEKYTFDFRFDTIEPLVVTNPEGEKEVYWYLVYTITNPSDAEHNFVPAFTLYSDTASVRRAGLHPDVFDAIQKRRQIRFLENAVKMTGKVLPGEDSARTGVAIFAPLDRETDHFRIFVEGLSGEYVERPNPAATDDTPEDEKVIRLRKTLVLEYKFPGDEWWLNVDQPIFVSKTWTWR
jgi:hypothetical protein